MQPQTPRLHMAKSFASIALLSLWLLSVWHCTNDCAGGDTLSGIKSAPTTTATSKPISHQSDHGDYFCHSLHSVCPILPSTALSRPDFGCLANFDFDFSAQLMALLPAQFSIRCQSPERKPVAMPEVCLGPAFYSLAPPVSSLS